MKFSSSKLNLDKILLSVGVICGVWGITINTASSQMGINPSIPVIRILRVTAPTGTTLKLKENWFQQSTQIAKDKRCNLRQGEKFFVGAIRKNITDAPAPPKGNKERIQDYWEVTFEKPLPCEMEGETGKSWYIYKNHFQELQAVPARL
ncbi:MAG TPA: hypothetical protein VK203_27910 [Nostocaceae cyanobacterium]|nr:hypothetical protein [Nostocaceae cyanobacterium]